MTLWTIVYGPVFYGTATNDVQVLTQKPQGHAVFDKMAWCLSGHV